MKYQTLLGLQEVWKKQVKQFPIHLIPTSVFSMGREKAFSVRKMKNRNPRENEIA